MISDEIIKKDIIKNKYRTLILTQTDPETDAVFKCWLQEKYNAAITFKNKNLFNRAFRRYWILNGYTRQDYWYGDWKQNLDQYDTIILHMDYLQKDIPKWIHSQKPNMRIICWWWNKVHSNTKPNQINDPNVEYWSFDEDDCIKYKMHKNIQYYIPLDKEFLKCIPSKTYDIIFFGHDHGRKAKILEVKNIASKQNISCNFHILDSKDQQIPYINIQRAVRQSKAVLEIMQDKQTGYTLRTMESLFMDCKLITDNHAILSAPFYRKSNIFVIGLDKWSELYKFLEQPYDDSVKIYQNQYNMDAWFANFWKDA